MLEVPHLVRAQDEDFAQPPEVAPPGAVNHETWPAPDGRAFGASYFRDGRWTVDLVGVGRYRFATGASVVEVAAYPGCSAATLEDNWLRQVLPLVIQAAGTEVLHASAVDTPLGVVAFAGHAGAGKSTMVWALERLGFKIWSDDALAFEPKDEGFQTHALPYRLRLRPGVLGEPGGEGQAKAVVSSGPEMLGSSRPLTWIVLMERAEQGDREGTLKPILPAEAVPRLLEQCWGLGLHAPENRRRLMERYLELAAGVRLVRFIRGNDVRTVESQARRLMEGLEAADAT